MNTGFSALERGGRGRFEATELDVMAVEAWSEVDLSNIVTCLHGDGVS